MKNLRYFLPLAIVFTFLSGCECSGEDPAPYHSCDQDVILSSSLYQSAPTDLFTLNAMAIEGNCLTINFSSGGCSGDTWVVKLIDSEAILESNPVQRNLVFSLDNNEMCDAYITKEISFDIASLQYGNSPLILNVVNADQSILYEY